MGFVPKQKIYRLNFTDTDYAGLEVRMTGYTVGELVDSMTLDASGIDLGELEKAATDGDVPAVVAGMDQLRKKVMGVFETFAAHLVEWNVDTADGQHVPETVDGVLTQDAGFIRDIRQAWQQGATAVRPDLGGPSRDGELSAALSLPMEPLSVNPES